MSWELIDPPHCKNCGRTLDPETASRGVIACPYCGIKWTFPRREATANVLNDLHFAEHELDMCNFDKAYDCYKRALACDRNEPEAYFGMALASFGIRFIRDDAAGGRLRPICHRILEKVFTECDDFLRAVKLASEEQRALYLARGAEIDDIRKKFAKLRKSGLHYDVFIAAKVTDGKGNYTQESHAAYKIYDFLKGEGFTPFYSERLLEGRTGSDYEAHILYALTSAPSMILICFREEYLLTDWVKNEYTRFLEMMTSGQKPDEALTLVFRNERIEHLSGYYGKLEAIDFGKPNAYSLILSHVKRCCEENKKKSEKKGAGTAPQPQAAANLLREQNKAKRLEIKERKRTMRLSKRESALQKKEQKQRQAEAREQAKEERQLQRRARKLQRAQKRQRTEESRKKRGERKKEGWVDNLVRPKARRTSRIGDFFRESTACNLLNFIVGLIILGGMLFVISYPFSIRIVRGSVEERAQLIVTAAVSGLIFLQFLYELLLYRTKILPTLVACVAASGVVPAICILIGWFCNNMHDWLWVWFSFGALGELLVMGICSTMAEGSYNSYKFYENTTQYALNSASILLACFSAMGLLCGNLYRLQKTNDGYADGFYYEVKADNSLCAYVREYDMAVLEIPEDLDGLPVSEFKAPVVRGGSVLESIVIPATIQKIGNDTFRDCTALTSIELPETLLEVGNRAFRGCARLSEAKISAAKLGSDTFRDCTSLTTVEMSDTVLEVGKYAFKGCVRLSEVKLSASLKTLSKGLFQNCIALTEIVVPDSVTVIEEKVFAGCSRLASFPMTEGTVWKSLDWFTYKPSFTWETEQSEVCRDLTVSSVEYHRG